MRRFGHATRGTKEVSPAGAPMTPRTDSNVNGPSRWTFDLRAEAHEYCLPARAQGSVSVDETPGRAPDERGRPIGGCDRDSGQAACRPEPGWPACRPLTPSRAAPGRV